MKKMELSSQIENFLITLFKKQFQVLLNSKSLMKTLPWNVKLRYNVFYVCWNKKTFLIKTNVINCILMVLLLLVSMTHLKCKNFPLMIHFLNLVQLFYSFPKLGPTVLSIGTFNYNLVCFLCDILSPLVPDDYSCKDTFSFVSKIKNPNLSRKFSTI